MQDSADVNTQAPAPEKPKTGKGWMICSIVLLFILVAVGSLGTMIILKGNRDTNRLSEVENELKEKNAKIEELEKAQSDAKEDDKLTSINLSELKKNTGDDNISIKTIEFTDDAKYLYLIANVNDKNGFGYLGTWYKEAKKDSSWVLLLAGNGFTSCSELSEEDKEFMSNYKEVGAVCINDDGTYFPE